MKWLSIIARAIQIYNTFVPHKNPSLSDCKELREVQKRATTRTDINDHLETLFVESIEIRPELIVELGVRGGESTFVFERVARLFESPLVSVDVEDCSNASNYEHWYFVQQDDVTFAGEFQNWCKEHELPDQIDILFIDTNHKYEHSRNEFEKWFPHLSKHAKVFLHDTNLTRFFKRKDGSLGMGWDNNRGVIRALEEFFETEFEESESFVELQDGWCIKHNPYCNGFTILQRIPGIG